MPTRKSLERPWEEPQGLYPDWVLTLVYEVGRWGQGLLLYTFCG